MCWKFPWRGIENVATVTLNGPSSRVIREMLEASFSTFNLVILSKVDI